MAEYINKFGGTLPTAENKKITDEDYAASFKNKETQSSTDPSAISTPTTPVVPSVNELKTIPNFAPRQDDEITKQLKTGAGKVIDEEAIRQQEIERIQAQVKAIENVYAGLVQKAEGEGVDHLGQQRAIAARGGLIGSDIGESQKTKVEEYNRGVIQGLEAEKAAKITALLTKADDKASERIQLENEQKRMDRDAYLKRLSEIQDESRKDLVQFAESGVKFEQLDPATQKLLADNTGFGGALPAVYNKLASGDLLDKLQKTSALGLALDESDQKVLDSIYGSGFSTKYVEVQKKATTAKNEKEEIQAAQDMVDILSKIPEGKKVKLGDAEYTGLKEVDKTKGLYVTTEEDAAGNVTQITTKYNPDTNKMDLLSTISLGKIGKGFKGSGGGGGGGDSIAPGTTLTKSQLNQAKGNYFAANPGKTEDNFSSLSSADKYAWYQGGPTGIPSEQIIKDGKNFIDVRLQQDKNVDEVRKELEEKVVKGNLTTGERNQLIDYLDSQGATRDAGTKFKFGKFKGKG